jgi:hypothetical protein
MLIPMRELRVGNTLQKAALSAAVLNAKLECVVVKEGLSCLGVAMIIKEVQHRVKQINHVTSAFRKLRYKSRS